MKLINIGFGNMISAGRLVAIVSPDSAPIKRMVQEARDRGTLIDATYGRRIWFSQRFSRTLWPAVWRAGRPLKQRRMRNDQKEREGTAHRFVRSIRCG